MDWILDHLGLVFIVGMGIASWFTARRKKAAEALRESQRGGGEQQLQPRHTYQQQPQVRELQDPRATVGTDDHTRRIQEEIRRKIAERRGQNETERPYARPPAIPAVVPTPTVVRRRETELSPYATDARREEQERATVVILERQRALEEQMAALNARKAAAKDDAKAIWAKPAADVGSSEPVAGARASSRAASVTGNGGDHVLLSELRNARSLRKAIVLREILGPPVGLQ